MNLPAEIAELIEDARSKRAAFDVDRSPKNLHASAKATADARNALGAWLMSYVHAPAGVVAA